MDVEGLLSHLKLSEQRAAVMRIYFRNLSEWYTRHKGLLTSLSGLCSAFKEKTDRLLRWFDHRVGPDSDCDDEKVVRSWFLAYLRCRDAGIFCATGECRCKFDTTAAVSSKKSQLKMKGKQRDGYTEYYKADVYSGYGYDEFNDDKVGHYARIKRALGKKREERFEDVSESLCVASSRLSPRPFCVHCSLSTFTTHSLFHLFFTF